MVKGNEDIKTYISDYWTLEYCLAYFGFKNKEMKACLIAALVKASGNKNSQNKRSKIESEINGAVDIEAAASYFYHNFKSVSKAKFAQYLAVFLESKFTNKADQLRDALPPYLLKAIDFVTKGEGTNVFE